MEEIFKEHYLYRRQIIKLAKLNLQKNSKGSALGWGWLILKPLITIFIYYFTLKTGLRVSKIVNGYPYFLWLVASMVPWFFMQEMMGKSIECIRKYEYLVTKMKFPISIIPTFVALSKAWVHVILMCIVIVIFYISGYPLDVYALQLPIYIALNVTFFYCFLNAIFCFKCTKQRHYEFCKINNFRNILDFRSVMGSK